MAGNVMMSISAKSIRPGPIPFSLYTRDSEDRMILFCRKSMPITDQHLDSLRKSGRVFYIVSSEMDQYLDYTFDKLENIVNSKHIPVQEKSRLLTDIGKRVVDDLLDNPRSGKAINNSERYLKSMISLLLVSPEASPLLVNMASSESYLLSHSIGTCVFVLMMGMKLFGRDREALHNLGLAGLLIDVGMTRISKSILYKAGPLSETEWAEMMVHSRFGYEILKSHNLPRDVLKAVLQHHERIDGSGYPDGLKGDEIHRFAQILMVADVYDALTTDRPHRKAIDHVDALKLMSEMGTKWKADVFNILLSIVVKNEQLIEKLSLN
jgi:HD-GYP domain-containing protein (c-di-GMP phosphodiesterase class II)